MCYSQIVNSGIAELAKMAFSNNGNLKLMIRDEIKFKHFNHKKSAGLQIITSTTISLTYISSKSAKSAKNKKKHFFVLKCFIKNIRTTQLGSFWSNIKN